MVPVIKGCKRLQKRGNSPNYPVHLKSVMSHLKSVVIHYNLLRYNTNQSYHTFYIFRSIPSCYNVYTPFTLVQLLLYRGAIFQLSGVDIISYMCYNIEAEGHYKCIWLFMCCNTPCFSLFITSFTMLLAIYTKYILNSFIYAKTRLKIPDKVDYFACNRFYMNFLG